MKRKALKNYTTTIPSEKTIMEIEYILAKHGATHIMKEYDDEGIPVGINFIIKTEFGKIPFKLPIDVERVRQLLIDQKESGRIRRVTWKQLENCEHAANVGWRILKDWIDAQLALIEIELVKLEQVFLPYAYDRSIDKTLYEAMKGHQFKGLLLTE